MPHKPPINLRELGKTGVLDEGRFYKKLSSKFNYVDEETVRKFYLAVVKTISSDLRENGVARLPHIGDFALVKQKKTSALVGTRKMQIEGAYMLKFYAKRAFSDYFKENSKLLGDSAKIDPREKVLGDRLINE